MVGFREEVLRRPRHRDRANPQESTRVIRELIRIQTVCAPTIDY